MQVFLFLACKMANGLLFNQSFLKITKLLSLGGKSPGVVSWACTHIAFQVTIGLIHIVSSVETHIKPILNFIVSTKSNLQRLIESIIEEEFAPAPQMGDIEPTPEDDEDRPLMDRRPDDGMDVSQHHKMMWAEGKIGSKANPEEEPDANLEVPIPWKVVSPQAASSVVVMRNDKTFKTGKVAKIDLKNLLASQNALFIDKESLVKKGQQKIAKKNLPIVIELPNKLRVIQDGHHRLVGLLLNKKKTGQVWLIKLSRWPDAFVQKYFKTGKEDFNLLDKEPVEENIEHLDEMSAISGGGGGLASSGKVSATSSGNAWKKQNAEHELMWSGDEPHDKRPKPGVKKKD